MQRVRAESIKPELKPADIGATEVRAESVSGKPEAKERRSKAPIIVWLLLCVIWGSTWLFIKLGLQDLPPISFAGIRFVIATALLLVIIAVRRAPLPRDWRDWRLILTTGILAFTINYGLLFWGEQHVSSGLASLLQAAIPLFGMVIANYYLPNERMTIRKLSGTLLGIAGVGLIFSNQMSFDGGLAFQGSAAIVGGALGAAYANVLVKARARHLDPAVLAAGQMFCGFVPLLIAGFTLEGNPLNFRWTALAIVSLLYLVLVGSVLAFLLYYWLVKRVDVTKTMLIALVTPLIAVTMGMLVLDEQLTWRIAAGGAAIISGIAIVVVRGVKLR